MSGGTFDYRQYMLEDIAEQIDTEIMHNDDPTGDTWEQRGGAHFRPDTLARMALAAATCRLAQAMATRVDYLLAGDDGEDSFHARWLEDVEPLAGEMMKAADTMAAELRKAGQ